MKKTAIQVALIKRIERYRKLGSVRFPVNYWTVRRGLIKDIEEALDIFKWEED